MDRGEVAKWAIRVGQPERCGWEWEHWGAREPSSTARPANRGRQRGFGSGGLDQEGGWSVGCCTCGRGSPPWWWPGNRVSARAVGGVRLGHREVYRPIANGWGPGGALSEKRKMTKRRSWGSPKRREEERLTYDTSTPERFHPQALGHWDSIDEHKAFLHSGVGGCGERWLALIVEMGAGGGSAAWGGWTWGVQRVLGLMSEVRVGPPEAPEARLTVSSNAVSFIKPLV
jgi:hypothetical protein